MQRFKALAVEPLHTPSINQEAIVPVIKMISEGRNNHLLKNWKCLIICCVVSMANCQYGFGKKP
jgi:hypothetical protein